MTLREARIDLGAVRANVAALKGLVAPALTMTVVKADAYGHGATEVARAAVDAGADWLGVADLDEALALRSAGIDAPVLAWLHAATTDFAPSVAARIDPGISTLDQLERAADVGAVVQLTLFAGLWAVLGAVSAVAGVLVLRRKPRPADETTAVPEDPGDPASHAFAAVSVVSVSPVGAPSARLGASRW